MNIQNLYISYGFDEYIKTFVQFKLDHPRFYTNKVSELVCDLDKASIYDLERFLFLMQYLPLPSRDFLIRKEVMYAMQERSRLAMEQRFKKNMQQYYSKYKLLGFEKLTINVFKYHCGLKLLPKDILSGLYHSIFVDGGAFWGDSVLIMQKYAPKKVIAFEPNEINQKALKSTVENNMLQSSVIISNYGLSDQSAQLELNYISKRQNHGSSFIFKPKKAHSHLASTIPLDQYLAQKKEQSRVGLIKLDVEGFGYKAIVGAYKTIKLYRPIISCAVYHNPEELFDIKPLLQKIHSDYRFKFVNLDQSSPLKELTLLAY